MNEEFVIGSKNLLTNSGGGKKPAEDDEIKTVQRAHRVEYTPVTTKNNTAPVPTPAMLVDYDRWIRSELQNMAYKGVPEWITNHVLHDHVGSTALNELGQWSRRLAKLRRLKKLTYVDPVNYICTVFKLSSNSLNISINYGFLYSQDAKYARACGEGSKCRGITPTFYCTSPSLISQDGEYRDRILDVYLNIAKAWELYSSELDAVEHFVFRKLERYELTIDTEHFFPVQAQEILRDSLEHLIVERGYAMRFLVAFWLVEIHQLAVNLQENNMNPKFAQIMFQNVDDDLQHYNKLVSRWGVRRTVDIITLLTRRVMYHAYRKVGLATDYNMGQKLRPLNVGEVQRPFDLIHSSWREIYITQRVNDLVAGMFSPCFGIFVGWFYIKNSRRGLFDNDQQYKKMQFSELAMGITRKLRETQHITYTTSGKNRTYVNEMFEHIYNQLEGPIEYSKTNLLMSNVTLAFLIENAGRTFYDVPLLNKSEQWIETVGDLLTDRDVFAKYTFDIMHALLCANVKLGVTHSDLHINNGTINNWTALFSISTTGKLPEGWEVWSVMGSWWMIPSRGSFSCIIDWSRGTIHPNYLRDYPHFHDREAFIEDQNQRMLHTLENAVPGFMKIHHAEVEGLMRTNFDKFYRLYTAVDAHSFSTKLSKFYGASSCVKSHVDMLNQIAKIAEHYLTSVMLRLITNPELNVEWPNLVILREVYTDWMFNPETPMSDRRINDVWTFDRPLMYSVDSYRNWPKFMQSAHGVTESGKVTVYKHMQGVDNLRKRYERYRTEQMATINLIARRHKEKYA